MDSTKELCSALLTEISIQTLRLLARSFGLLSAVSSHPLFSIAATSALLVLLYVPPLLLPFLFSPALISTLLLLAALLRFGSAPPLPPPQAHQEPPSVDPPLLEPETDSHDPGLEDFHQKTAFRTDFVEWGRRGGPLEVIYEEYEGEEDDGDGGGESPRYSHLGDRRFGSCYTDSDTESDDDDDYLAVKGWDSPENLCFRWGEGEEGDDLIDISLEEENMIEIDISGCR